MTWSDQTEAMMKVWTEAQKTMWQNWYNAVQAASAPTMFSPNILDEWRKLATQGMEMWTSGAEPAFKNMSSQFVSSQAAMMQMLQFTTEAWQAMAPKLDAGEDWQTVMSNYVEKIRQQLMPDAQGITQTSQDTAELWRMYMDYLKNAAQPWMGFMGNAPALMGQGIGGDNSAAFMELTSMYWNAFDTTFGSLSQSPGFGFTREHQERIATAFDSWQKVQRSYNNYQSLMADAWSKVFEQVLQELKDRAENDKPIESIRDLARLWIGAADRSFDKIFRSEAYSKAQGQFVSDYMTYRIHEQAVMEEMMRYSYVATRGEVDEAHRNIHQLRREVRSLKKALQQQQAPAPKSPSKSKAEAEAKQG